MLTSRRTRTGLWLGGCALVASAMPTAGRSAAQVQPNFGSPGLYREDPASALGRYLRVITANPRDLEALTGAGRAALQVGDAQAAIGFYARAEAISPRNGRIKAGLGSALVLLNQEQAALKYFGEAVALGVPDADVASDRGLAHDLRGSSKLAQRDYAIALRRGEDPETTRRMALSLAIGGEREAALKLLDPLLRKQDTAAWRARAFILAMTGDAAGANRAAESVMTASAAAGFAPFFRKLPALRAGEKAAAVHFGNFPGEGRPMRIDDLFNQAEVAARVALENTPRSALDAGRIDSLQGALGTGASRQIAARSVNAEGQLAAPVAVRPGTTARSAPIAVTPRANTLTPRAATGARTGVATAVVPSSPGFSAGAPASMSAIPRAANASPIRLADISETIRAAASQPLPGVSPAATGALSTTPAAIDIMPSTVPVLRVATPPVTISQAPPSSSIPSAPAVGAPAGDRSIALPTGIGQSQSVAPAASPARTATPVDLPASSSPQQPDLGIRLGGLRQLLAGAPDASPGAAAGTVAAVAPPSAAPPQAPSVTSTNGTQTPAGTSVVTTADLPPSQAPAPVTTLSAAPPAPQPRFENGASGVQRQVGTPAAISSPTAPPAPRPKVETRTVAAVSAAPAPRAEGASRIWVQVAGGADEKALPFEWRRLKTRAPELLASQTAWTTPLRATNRLLVGPFANENEAQEFVNKLKPKGIIAFSWTSPTNQEIAKLAGR